ncbi:hypothetical protein [Xanthomonas sp. LMG 12461]|uniref:DUF7079 family protein n=1 Tax=Xanthomonas sp. LMG 12461 TaxID=2014543 RepID=UPI0012640492|nr:hypothetical protein [Xanthomonas sp. LMG 12461]KAB7768532.1 hypothetical protein CEK68_05595 [Xanthomonas sp. LMG 12461]
MSATGLAARRAVWDALATLYLDTAVDAHHPQIAAVLAASPFATDTLWQMLREDVHPRLAPNLLTPAGAWQGIDGDWLSAAIQQRRGAHRVSAWRTRDYPRQQWRLLLPQVLAQRAAH